MARIEAAAARIEAAVRLVPAADPAIQARYDTLRQEAERTLVEVDRLIGTLAPS